MATGDYSILKSQPARLLKNIKSLEKFHLYRCSDILTALQLLARDVKKLNTAETNSRSVTKWRCSPSNEPSNARMECCLSTSRNKEIAEGESGNEETISLRI